MQISVKVGEIGRKVIDLVAIPLLELEPKSKPKERRLGRRVTALDRSLGGVISAALGSGDFRGRAGEALTLYPAQGSPCKRVLLLGLGKEAKLASESLRGAAGRTLNLARAKSARQVVMLVPSLRRVAVADGARAMAEGAVLASYRFDDFREPKKDETPVRSFDLAYEKLRDVRAVRAAAAEGVVVAESQNLARKLSDQPGNALPPAALAREAVKVAKAVGLRSRVMEVPELKRRKMGGILAVGQGSANPPRLVILEHKPASRAAKGSRRPALPTICLVGKGITFDSGGISLKPSPGMQDMKHDMSGAAAVVGAMRAIALLKLPLHVVGVIAAAENMPGASAYRPGDIITTMAGKTIEITNTDAEGRVVLADALHFADVTYEPQAMIDLATLTGACLVALGPWATGLLGNHEGLIEAVREAGERCGERCWQLPLLDEHKEAMKSTVADLKNAGGRHAGTSTAAGFLSAFVGERPWVHLDIAGTGWSDKAGPYQRRGATGVGVRALIELLRDWQPPKGV